MKPEYLITGEQVERHVANRTPESLVLEYKKLYDSRPPDAGREAARDIGQFANADGGVLLFGIEESGGFPATPVGVPGVPNAETLKQQMSQVIARWLSPDTIKVEMVALPVQGVTVLALNVFPLFHPVSLWDKQQDRNAPIPIEYPVRTNHGKRSLDPGGMERLFMDLTRATRLRLVSLIGDAKPASKGFPVPGKPIILYHRTQFRNQEVYSTSKAGHICIGDANDSYFCLNFEWKQGTKGYNPVHCPYSWLQDAWLDHNGYLCLQMDATAQKHSHESATELFPSVR